MTCENKFRDGIMGEVDRVVLGAQIRLCSVCDEHECPAHGVIKGVISGKYTDVSITYKEVKP